MDNKRQKRNHSILFEHLFNELFTQISSYINGVDALFAFSTLNYRFKCLVIVFCQFDFKSICKTKFDVTFRQLDTKRWKSLRLSNDDDTPGQIEYFFQNYSLTDHFPQLKSFAITNMKPLCTDTLVFQLPSLTNLVSLTIESVCGRRMSKLELPILKRLVVSSCRNIDWIKVVFANDEDDIWVQESCGNLSKLITLEIYQREEENRPPNGQVWEQLIRSSLPLLKNFKFYSQFEYSSYPVDQVEQVVLSFSTRFYTLEKKWFIRWNRYSTDRNFAVLYSLPFAFDKLTFFTGSFDRSISTLSNNNNFHTNMETVAFERKFLKSNEKFNRTEIVNLVINNSFYSINWIHILTKLRHLEITYGAMVSPKTFNLLLDSTPNLYSLTVEKSVLQEFTCNQLSRKIRSLKSYSVSLAPWSLNRYELYEILRPFVAQCEHLSLDIQLSNETVAFILQIFRQLQSLNILIKEQDCSEINIAWLEQQTTKLNHPNTFISHDQCTYSFWLGRRC